MSHISAVLNQSTDAATYASIATAYSAIWHALAVDPTRTHVMLTYHNTSTSHTLLYNIFPALLLDLPVISPGIFTMQSAFYPQIAATYGVPLDNRFTWTKSDWEMWAGAGSAPATRKMFVERLARWINETGTDMALTDHYETDTGGYTSWPFIARSVVGGHFSLLALGIGGGGRGEV
jgi:hypothetical protein